MMTEMEMVDCAVFVVLRQAFNSLVDQCSIEKHCVFSSKEEAETVCLQGRDGKFEVRTNEIHYVSQIRLRMYTIHAHSLPDCYSFPTKENQGCG